MLLKRALFLSEDQVSELMCVRGGHFHPPTQHFFRKDITTSARAVIEKHWLSDVFRIALQQKCETRSGSCMFYRCLDVPRWLARCERGGKDVPPMKRTKSAQPLRPQADMLRLLCREELLVGVPAVNHVIGRMFRSVQSYK